MSCGKKKKQPKVDAQYHDKYVTSNLDGVQEKEGELPHFPGLVDHVEHVSRSSGVEFGKKVNRQDEN